MSTHTPGPWAYHFGTGLLVTARENGDIPLNSRVIAKVTEANESDLRLIATAPALLEALQFAESALFYAKPHIGTLRRGDWDTTALLAAIEKARAAIRAAKGERI